MTDYLSAVHFEDLSACNPASVEENTGAFFIKESACYKIRVWDTDFTIDIKNSQIFCGPGLQGPLKGYWDLFIIHYLIGAGDMGPANQWVSEKDLVGGAGFFRGPHLLPLHKIIDRFGDDMDAFKEKSLLLNGTSLDFADAAFRFEITPKVPVAVLYWQGDDDFPSEAKMLFDQTIEQHLALDIVYALAVAVCNRLAH